MVPQPYQSAGLPSPLPSWPLPDKQHAELPPVYSRDAAVAAALAFERTPPPQPRASGAQTSARAARRHPTPTAAGHTHGREPLPRGLPPPPPPPPPFRAAPPPPPTRAPQHHTGVQYPCNRQSRVHRPVGTHPVTPTAIPRHRPGVQPPGDGRTHTSGAPRKTPHSPSVSHKRHATGAGGGATGSTTPATGGTTAGTAGTAGTADAAGTAGTAGSSSGGGLAITGPPVARGVDAQRRRAGGGTRADGARAGKGGGGAAVAAADGAASGTTSTMAAAAGPSATAATVTATAAAAAAAATAAAAHERRRHGIVGRAGARRDDVAARRRSVSVCPPFRARHGRRTRGCDGALRVAAARRAVATSWSVGHRRRAVDGVNASRNFPITRTSAPPSPVCKGEDGGGGCPRHPATRFTSGVEKGRGEPVRQKPFGDRKWEPPGNLWSVLEFPSREGHRAVTTRPPAAPAASKARAAGHASRGRFTVSRRSRGRRRVLRVAPVTQKPPQRHTYFQADSEGRGPGFGEKCGANAVAATQRLGAFVEDYLAT
ncbi:hypothetical protein BU14_0127s0048 [Porphyra umbilicalis]|uniref:Uncharacterized protein n=1 Tax=Porphyra umbilicalis TaxID=2786 RepID=A0A1X6PB16_PORUM|nr:hypothetical protein BU14_0127s0048 [Porphyra umbilicalis]|eukprot:OSX77950.1 hypothetical protein BU14_0127s0048 [Porphyra umbilicalis]